MLMEEMQKHGRIARAARKADMDRKTARKYVKLGKLPSELAKTKLSHASGSVLEGGLVGGHGEA